MPSKPNSAERKLPEFAPMEPDYALARGLFRSVPNGAHRRTLELVYGVEGGDPESAGWRREVEFVSPYLLGPTDLRTLQGLMALAAQQAIYWEDRSWVLSRPEDELGRQLALRFEARDEDRERRVLQISGSLADLARAVGVDERSGKAIGILKRSLKRLTAVTVWLRHIEWRHAAVDGRLEKKAEKREGSSRLASACWAEGAVGAAGALRAAVNPALSEVAMAAVVPGGAGIKYIRMDMREVRALRTGAARLIHQRLCAWINPGDGGKVRLSTLCEYVYPEDAPTPNAAKGRRKAVRRALRELVECFEPPWGVDEYAPARFAIARPNGVAADAVDRSALALREAPEDADAATEDGEAVRRTVECRVAETPAQPEGRRS